jgi:hypothetical protein
MSFPSFLISHHLEGLNKTGRGLNKMTMVRPSQTSGHLSALSTEVKLPENEIQKAYMSVATKKAGVCQICT